VIAREPDSRVVRQVVCASCGVTIEYVPADILLYGNGVDRFACPCCFRPVVVQQERGAERLP